MKRSCQLVFILSFFFIGLAGCVISPRRGLGATASTQSATGQIYVSNSAHNSIVRFANAPNATGDIAPAATISGPATQLASPQYLLIDPQTDRLFVANEGTSAVLIFEKASTRNGDTSPDRKIAGPSTTLVAPVDLALDPNRDQLYVADGSNILVFAPASTANGDMAPVRTIATGFQISGLLFDRTGDRLFVLNSSSNAVEVYDSGHLLDHTISPNRIVSGRNTKLAQPSGLQLDTAGRLLVTNFSGASVTIFSNATTVNGDVAPAGMINGSKTGMGAPSQIAMAADGSGADLYVADGAAGGVLVFSHIESSNGDATPARVIEGSKTGLQRSAGGAGAATAKGIALDTTR